MTTNPYNVTQELEDARSHLLATLDWLVLEYGTAADVLVALDRYLDARWRAQRAAEAEAVTEEPSDTY